MCPATSSAAWSRATTSPLETLDLAYAVSGFGATRGTLRSALEAMKGGDVVWEDGAWLPAGPGPLRASAVFPEPFGREVVAKYPCGEIVSVPRHTRVRTLRARIAVSGLVPAGPLAPLVPPLMAALAPMLRTPVRRALQAAIGLLPEGPPEDARRASRFRIVVAVRGADGSVGRASRRAPTSTGSRRRARRTRPRSSPSRTTRGPARSRWPARSSRPRSSTP